MSRAIALLLAASCLAACSSVDSGTQSRLSLAEGEPTRVSFVDYRTGVRMNLVNEAHTDPLELYSQPRTDANTKVISNEVMAAMIEYFGDQGFRTWAQRGYAPATSRGGEVQSFELETPAETLFLVTRGGKTNAEQAFRECRTAFLQIQELTMQAQAIRNDRGEVEFKQPEPSEKFKNR